MSTAIEPSRLLTWGLDGKALGRPEEASLTPARMQRLPPDNIVKVVEGNQSKGLITERGDLYVFGSNVFGQLGSGAAQQDDPQMINFFSDAHKRVLDAAIGKYHSAAVTEDGAVFTWGSAGLISLILSKISSRSYTSLGRHEQFAAEPSIVALPSKCTGVAVGNSFTVAVSDQGELFGWGKFRAGSQDPGVLREAMREAEKAHSPVVRAKAVGDYLMFQLANGSLFSYGKNVMGAMAARQNPQLRTDIIIAKVNKVVDQDFKGGRVVDYEVGQSSSIFLLDNGKVFFSGLDLKFRPEQIPLPQGVKVHGIAASNDSVAVATDKGVFMVGEFMPGRRHRAELPMFFSPAVYQAIGGRYGDRWASK